MDQTSPMEHLAMQVNDLSSRVEWSTTTDLAKEVSDLKRRVNDLEEMLNTLGRKVFLES